MIVMIQTPHCFSCSSTFIFVVLMPSEEDDPGDEVITGEGKGG